MWIGISCTPGELSDIMVEIVEGETILLDFTKKWDIVNVTVTRIKE